MKERSGGTLVVADPTFEAILYHAKLNDAEIVKVPLTPSFGHDLPKMMAAAKKGLVYVCNPNNPTASISPKNEVREFIEKTPAETMILVDEAYHHYADSPDYESMIPLVKDHPNLIVARTFSKIYGMAGLRCGYCVAQSRTIERLRERQSWDSINIMALAAATASLEDPDQVTKGRRLNAETRAFTTGELEKMGFQTIPSQANFIMIDVKRPVVPLIATLKNRKVRSADYSAPCRTTCASRSARSPRWKRFWLPSARSPARSNLDGMRSANRSRNLRHAGGNRWAKRKHRESARLDRGIRSRRDPHRA